MTRSLAASRSIWLPGWSIPRPCGCWTAATFRSRGRKSAGVARQYCGRLGKVANCQAGMFLAYVSPLGRALVAKRLYLPESWTSDDARCAAAGVPADKRQYRSKDGVGSGDTGAGLGAWPSEVRMGCRGRRPSGCRRPSGRAWRHWGMRYVLDVPEGTTAWPPEPEWTASAPQGRGRPRKPRAGGRATAHHGGAQ